MSDGDVFDIQEEVEGSPWNPAIEAKQDNQSGTDHKGEDKTDSIDIPEEAAGKKNCTSSFKYCLVKLKQRGRFITFTVRQL